MSANELSGFRRLALTTIVAVYVLILVGGIVRSTGSGMGCPDWPKCFGSWVPPTSEAQLPALYKEHYVEKRLAKNARVASMLRAIGANETADRLLTDPAVRQEQPFNAVQTWIEYINRLVGVVIGLLIVATFVAAFRKRRLSPGLGWLTFASVLLVVFQAWIGSVVVSANLLPGIITLHMLLAVLLVGLLIYAYARSLGMSDARVGGKARVTLLLTWGLFALALVQMVLGTEVREGVDHLTRTVGYDDRGNHLLGIGVPFIVHRSLSWLVLIGGIVFYYRVQRLHGLHAVWRRLAFGAMLCILISMFTGVAMAYLNIPRWSQPVHLLTGSLLTGLLLATVFTAKFAPESSRVRFSEPHQL